jgi:precorrin-3B methylase
MTQAATILTRTAGKRVAIFGTGDCGVYGDTESISYFHTVD